MTKVEEFLGLVTNVAKGEDRVGLGAVGYYGYGFIFRDPFNSKVPYIIIKGSSKFCTLRLLLRRSIFQQDFDKHNLKGLREYMMKADNYDILLAGSLKTLVPTLQFGGDERLFFSWVFIMTPDGKRFPATFYYGQSGMSLGGWKSYEDDSGNKIFPRDFESIINISPFEFSRNELEELVEALEHALRKIPTSDFYGVYKHDFGQTLMGISYGRPFTMELRRPMNNNEIEKLINSFVF